MSTGLSGSNLPANLGLERTAVTAGVDYRFSPESTFGGGVGAGIGGLITLGARRFHVGPGWLLTLAYSRRLLDGTGNKPFVVLSFSGGASGTSTREELTAPGMSAQSAAFYAFDVRAGLTVGKTFWKTLSPYSTLRVFGGPVIWSLDGKSVSATDVYHFQLGVGMLTSLPRGFDIFAEVIPAGERAVSLGAGKTF